MVTGVLSEESPRRNDLLADWRLVLRVLLWLEYELNFANASLGGVQIRLRLILIHAS